MPKKDGYEHGAPSWVDLATTDVDAAKDFYSGLFGWDWTGAPMSDGSGNMGTYWMSTIDGLRVAGLSGQPPSMQDAPSAWFTYINVDSVDATTAQAKAAGAEVMMRPQDVGESGRMAFVVDPNGAPIGMWQAGGHRGAGLVDEPGATVWHEVRASDTEAAVAFYGTVFGWSRGSMEFPEGGAYTTFLLGETTIGGAVPPQMEGVPPHWHVWFGTADTAETVARAADLGGTVLLPPTGSPIGAFASLADPAGAAFSVIATTPPA